jgi:hypothetical protein
MDQFDGNAVDLKPFNDAAQNVYPKCADKVGGMKLIEEIATR